MCGKEFQAEFKNMAVTLKGTVSGKVFCFCNKCQGKAFSSRKGIEAHLKRAEEYEWLGPTSLDTLGSMSEMTANGLAMAIQVRAYNIYIAVNIVSHSVLYIAPLSGRHAIGCGMLTL